MTPWQNTCRWTYTVSLLTCESICYNILTQRTRGTSCKKKLGIMCTEICGLQFMFIYPNCSCEYVSTSTKRRSHIVPYVSSILCWFNDSISPQKMIWSPHNLMDQKELDTFYSSGENLQSLNFGIGYLLNKCNVTPGNISSTYFWQKKIFLWNIKEIKDLFMT